MKKLTALLLMIILSSCASINTVKVDNIKTTQNDGFYYALPKKHLVLTFEIEKTTKKPGKYLQYAHCFGFNPSDLIQNASESYALKDVKVTSKTLLDVSEVYLMKVNNKILKKTGFELEYATNGELVSGSFENSDEVIPLIQTVAKFASTAFLKDLSQGAVPPGAIACTTSDDYDRAKDIFDKIAASNTGIADMLGGLDRDMDLETMKYSLEQLKKIRAELVSNFSGTITKDKQMLIYEVNPSDFEDSAKELFKISESTGVQLVTQSSNPDFKFKKSLSGLADAKSVKIAVDKKGNDVSAKIIAKADVSKGSFYYRIPANSSFKISEGATIKKKFSSEIPQFGAVVSAPVKLNKVSFSLHPGLGSIKMVKGVNDPITNDSLSGLGGTIKDIRSQLRDEDEKDELISELEKDVKIKELQDKLNGIDSGESEN